MTDVLTPEQRRRAMWANKSEGTVQVLMMRDLLEGMGAEFMIS